MSTDSTAIPVSNRIASLDQYRGYAIFGMLLVNFFGHYRTAWVTELSDSWLKDGLGFIFGQQLHHHNEFMTYADTIAPIFMFVVGIGMRLSWTRRVKHVDPGAARKAMAKRYFTIVLIAFAIYSGWLWDALMSIGLAGLVAVLIVDKKWSIRIAYALGLVVAYQLIFSYTSYGEWLLRLGKYGRELDWPWISIFLPLRDVLLDVPINGGLLGHWS
ncbi:MAG: heparan-alpha-glucosaminide N-acetyltransferase domain-containing protein, partial [Candidatus Hydrogenedentes bacterium]|nr:heparan-alpha-glucosaminide N-acetyltransferase domain-containing protein [Candidatus Hydrogenedentota bacterium]